jgi:hypothetical protein
LVRCTTKTIAIRNSDNAVWQSSAMGTVQNLAAAWRTPFGTGGSAIGLSVTGTPVGRASVGDDLSKVLLKARLFDFRLYPRCCTALHSILLLGYVF